MRFSARIPGLVIAFLLLILLPVLKTPAFAQTQAPTQNTQTQQYLTPNTDSNVPNNLHTFSQNVVLEVMSSMVCQLIGIDPVNPNQQCLGVDSQTGKIGYVQNGGGVIGAMGTMIAGLYTVPVRLGDYIAYVSGDFGITKNAQAATNATGQIGYDSLLPVIGLWKTFRDIAYLLFVLVFLIIGFAIMLRIRIDPRTVMTIQNQIPKLIIGILLVTFSYAIAGFLIDLMWIGNYVIVSTIAPADNLSTNDVMSQSAQGAPGFVNYIFGPGGGGCPGGILSVTCSASGAIGDIIQNVFTTPTSNGSRVLNKQIQPSGSGQPSGPNQNPLCYTPLAPLCIIGNLMGSTVQDIIGNILGVIVSWLVRIAAFLIIGIAILWALIKLWFTLIKAYVFILIDVVLAPFWIVAGIFPKAPQSVGFTSWLKDLVANLVVFPTVIALFVFGKIIMDNFGSQPLQTAFNPPLIGGISGNVSQIGITGPSSTQGIGALIALGIILMSPSIAESIKKALKTSGVPSGFSGLSTGTAVVGGFVGGATSNLMRRDQYGRAVGRGAIFMDTHVTNPMVRNVLGWNQKTPEEIQEQIKARRATRETERTGGSSSGGTPPAAQGLQPPTA